MSGRYLLDTNIIVLLLKGNLPQLTNTLKNAEWIGISVISYTEFLAFSNLKEEDIILFENFLSRIEVINLNADSELIKSAIEIRKKGFLKLPDAIIAATAKQYNATIVTADKDFEKQTDIDLLIF